MTSFAFCLINVKLLKNVFPCGKAFFWLTTKPTLVAVRALIFAALSHVMFAEDLTTPLLMTHTNPAMLQFDDGEPADAAQALFFANVPIVRGDEEQV